MYKKVIAISNGYFLTTLAKLLIISPFIIFFGYGFLYKFGINESKALTIGIIISTIINLIILIGDVIYKKQSGIFINDHGDHIVKWGGWTAKEDKLLNGIVIANQVERGPIDQLLGMGTITTGVMGTRKLVGARYKDIEHYDDLMRKGNSTQFTSIF